MRQIRYNKGRSKDKIKMSLSNANEVCSLTFIDWKYLFLHIFYRQDFLGDDELVINRDINDEAGNGMGRIYRSSITRE